MKKIKVLLVGHGPRGMMWSKVIRSNKNFILIGICDINYKTRNKVNDLIKEVNQCIDLISTID